MNKNKERILSELKKYFKASKLVFFSREIERGLGIAIYFTENFKIVYRQFDAISNQLGNDNRFIHKNFIGSSSALARTHQFNTQEDTHLFFKYTNQLNSHIVWNNPPRLTRKLENKLFLPKLLDSTKIKKYLPEQRNKSLVDINLDLNVKKLGNVVLQLPFGHTGNTTFIIDQNKAEEDNQLVINELKNIKEKYPNRLIKLSKLVKGIPLTVNACATNAGTFVAGLSVQVSGVDELSTDRAVTCGNDWSLANELFKNNNQLKELVIEITESIGNLINKKYGFMGIFGLDLIYDAETEKLYLIELNPRQVASINYFTRIQENEEDISLQLIHLESFRAKTDQKSILNKNIINIKEYNYNNLLKYRGSQISLRGSSNSTELFGVDFSKINTGNYKIKKDNLFLNNLEVQPLEPIKIDSLNIYNNFWLKSEFDYFAEIIKVQHSDNLVTLDKNKLKLKDFKINL